MKSFRWSYIVMYLLYLFVLWKIDVLFLNMVCKEISLNSIFKGNWKSLKTIQIAWNRLNIHVYGFVLIEDLNFVFFLFSIMKKNWNSDVWSRPSICCFIHMPRTETLAWKIEFAILICRQWLGCDYYSIQEYCKTYHYSIVRPHSYLTCTSNDVFNCDTRNYLLI